MSEAPDLGHLTSDEVTELLRIVHQDNAIVVGDQSVNIWAERYADRDDTLVALGALTSKDIDFYRNKAAAQHLAEALHGEVKVPALDDPTPNAAMVMAKIGGRQIIIDFMDAILGVSDKNLCSRYVGIAWRSPESNEDINILLLHPLDCVVSRLSNINTLHRTSELSLKQMRASVAVLRLFIKELLDEGKFREVQDTLMELVYVIRDRHIGKETHTKFNIDLCGVLEHFLHCEGLDQRWRDNNLRNGIDRLRKRMERLTDQTGRCLSVDK